MPLTYVIADLHGRFDLLQAALGTIAEHAGGRAFKIVTLGDYVDRGPQSREVIGRLMAVQAAGTNLICLKGNHEYMMHRALTLTWFASASRARCLSWWKHNGGESTLTSYGNEVPSDHLRWMKNLPTIHVDEHRIFVHAGVDPTRTLDEQTDEFLLWHRYSESADVGHGRRHVVHGHTPNPQGPELLSRRTNLDTLAWQTGRLVIAVFDDHTPGPATGYIELPGAQTASPAMHVAHRSDGVRREVVSDVVARTELSLSTVDNRKKDDPFRDLDLGTKIALRWTLRDIEAKRWMIAPINPIHLEKLMALNLVEIRNDDPALTRAGLEALGAS
jgi:serine/threonine protein phosphatase 1